MIKYVNGDLFRAKEEILIHGCNCFNTMGAGVARMVKTYYPEAAIVDLETEYGSKEKLGSYTCTDAIPHYYRGQSIVIVNAYTQYSLGGNRVNVDYDAVRKVMEEIKEDFKGYTKCMPKIGAGLAGGDWNKIERIINEVIGSEEIVVYYI